MERVADYIIGEIKNAGVDTVFLVNGRGVLYLTDALAREKGLTSVSTYHEQGASYAAMAYASARDGLGVCLVSTGCAATNAVTAALCAYQDNLPMVFISGQNMLEETTRHTGVKIRTYGSQEADIVGVVESITKYATMLEDPRQVAYVIEKALHLAQVGRKGPVWVDVPLDIQNARIDPDSLQHYCPKGDEPTATMQEIADVVAGLSEAERPAVLIGGGVRRAGACDEIAAFVKRTGVPLLFTPTASDVYGSGNEMSIGAVGSLGGSRAGNFVLQNADYVLAVGTKLCSQTTGVVETFAREAIVVAVDVDPVEHTKKGADIGRRVVSDARSFLTKLLEEPLPQVSKAWAERCLHWKDVFSVSNEAFKREYVDANTVDIYGLADALSCKIEDDAVVITDAGFEELIIPSAIRYQGKQRCLFPAAQGAMGFAIPAVLGAHYAGKGTIVVVVGDGSIMMNIQELQTIVHHDIPAKIIVVNNNMYAVIRKRQHDLFRKRTLGNDPSDGLAEPNFEGIAEAFGLSYMSIDSLEELDAGLDDMLAAEGPVMCEVHCVPDQIYLHESYALDERKRLVRRPLEDLSPFMPREQLRNEMLIETLE